MGSLQGYGAVAGAAGEYLDQSRETRKNDFTLLRDKRLSELKQGDQTHAAGLVSDENRKTEKNANENYTFGYGEQVVRGGEVVNEGADRPVAGSNKKFGNLITLINGDQQTEEQLRKTYDSIWKANTDEWGSRIGDFDLPGYDEWRNGRVAEQHRVNVQKPEAAAVETTASSESVQEATKWAEGINSGFTPLKTDKDHFGGLTQDEAIQKKALELDAAKKKRGGMLTEDAATADTDTQPKKTKALPLQRPLSQSAKTDPVQMYDELQAQGFDEPDIIDTIRTYFQDPTWEIPPNALK